MISFSLYNDVGFKQTFLLRSIMHTTWESLQCPWRKTTSVALVYPLPLLAQQCCCEILTHLVQVDYVHDLGPPIMSIKQARAAGAFHELWPIPGTNTNLPEGTGSALPAVAASPMQIRGARWRIPNQTHFYMEPQTAVAKWDEGGNVLVRAATLGFTGLGFRGFCFYLELVIIIIIKMVITIVMVMAWSWSS
jgi:hypothetical protein